MKRFLAVCACCAFVTAALAQHDPTSVWPQFRADNAKSGRVSARGPATELDWFLDMDPIPNPDDPANPFSVIPSPAGFTVAGNGDLYYKSHDDNGSFVFRIDPDDGTILAQSPNLGGAVGNYGGVAVGIDKVYVTVHPGNKIVVLDKTTLAVLDEWINPTFAGLRGTPLLGDIPNDNGHVNIYVQDRNANKIHAVDSATGTIMWSHPVPFPALFSQLGPTWVTDDGRQALAFFATVGSDPNGIYPGAGVALADNGDNTYQVLWENAGPECFNWIGSGALSADGSRIYVTTFWDCDNNTLWAVDVTDGHVIWGVPGNRGEPNEAEVAYNSFGRPAVLGNRVYIPGGYGLIACFEDLGDTYELKWEMRDLDGEVTSVSVAQGPDGVYVYGAKQGVSEPEGFEEYVVLRDDGDSYTELLRMSLDLTRETSSGYANNSVTIDADGNVYIGLGRANWLAGVTPGAIYKFAPPAAACPGDVDGDGDTDLSDLAALLAAYGTFTGDPNYNPAADFDSDGDVDLADLAFLLADYGCLP